MAVASVAITATMEFSLHSIIIDDETFVNDAYRGDLMLSLATYLMEGQLLF